MKKLLTGFSLGKPMAAALREKSPGVFCFLAVFFVLCSCPANAQDTSGISQAFADAGIPLLKEALSPAEFSLPVILPTIMPLIKPSAADITAKQSLGGLKGKVVFLNFWATWCGPCRAEMPSMEALYKRYREEGLEILAVNSGENADEVLAFMRNYRLSFPSVLDGDRRVSATYGIQAIPTTFLLNREGKIIARVVGSIDWDTPKIRAVMEALLNS